MAGMSEPTVDIVTPKEPRSIADENTLDAKFRAVAAAKRAKIAQDAAAGTPAPLLGTTERIMALMPKGETPRDQIVRVQPDEGDRPEIPAAVRAAIVPPRFASVAFDTYEPSTRGQGAALKAARFWTDRARKGECSMLALIGPQGTGKSHLLYAAANALLDDGRRCYARPWYRLADELRYGGESPFVAGRTIEAFEVRSQLWKQRIVLLDEVRPTASTAFDDTELAKFACWAYDSKLSVFITSNVSPLADVMGPPAASRFTQVIIDGPDRRQA